MTIKLALAALILWPILGGDSLFKPVFAAQPPGVPSANEAVRQPVYDSDDQIFLDSVVTVNTAVALGVLGDLDQTLATAEGNLLRMQRAVRRHIHEWVNLDPLSADRLDRLQKISRRLLLDDRATSQEKYHFLTDQFSTLKDSFTLTDNSFLLFMM